MRVLLRSKVRLGPECGNASADVLPALTLEQTWKLGRFMRDMPSETALVTQLPLEECGPLAVALLHSP